jgi:hypothetical protein
MTKIKGQSIIDNQETLIPFGYTRHRTMTKGQPRDTDIIWVHKTQDEDAWIIKNGKSRETGTIGYTRPMTKTKGQSRMDNQEILTPFGYRIQRTKTKMQSKIKNKLLLAKRISGIAPF